MTQGYVLDRLRWRRMLRRRGSRRSFVWILELALAVYLIDLAASFRIQYMGVGDDTASQFVLRDLWRDVVAIQGWIIVCIVAISALLWAWARFTLRLSRRQSFLAAGALWLALIVRHARVWPAPYTDIRDVRPIADRLFIAVIEGWAGRIVIAGSCLFIAAMVVSRIRRELRRGMAIEPQSAVLRAAGVAAATVLLWQVGALPTLPEWRRTPLADPNRPDVLILMSDSWRADHFECRADSAVTPRLGGLCQRMGLVGRARLFDPAYPAQTRTFGSVSAMFTQQPPHRTGIVHMFPLPEYRDLRAVSLLREFTRAGYTTLAVSGLAGDFFPRVELGFDHVEAPRFGFRTIVAEFSLRSHPAIFPFLATNRLGRWIQPYFRNFADLGDAVLEGAEAVRAANQAPGDRPLLLTLFLSATHSPYAGREGTAWRRGDDPVKARYRWYPLPYEAGRVDAATARAVRHRYADAVQSADAVLGAIAEAALARGNTLVLVASDHGEQLYEFGEGSHGDHVYGNHAMQVPVLALDSRAGVAPFAAPPSRPVIYRTMDVVAAAAVAATTATPFELPPTSVAFVESGIIISPFNPPLLEGRRVPYPEILGVLEIDRDTGEIVVQRKWAEAVERGKFRAVVTPDWTFVYSPGPREPRLSMFPRSATADALPEFSQHAQYPQAVDWAWRAAIAHWGPELVQRDHPVWH